MRSATQIVTIRSQSTCSTTCVSRSAPAWARAPPLRASQAAPHVSPHYSSRLLRGPRVGRRRSALGHHHKHMQRDRTPQRQQWARPTSWSGTALSVRSRTQRIALCVVRSAIAAQIAKIGPMFRLVPSDAPSDALSSAPRHRRSVQHRRRRGLHLHLHTTLGLRQRLHLRSCTRSLRP